MNRTEKKDFVSSFNSTLKDVSFLLVAHYKGLTVSEITSLREQIKENNATFKVTKNSLAKKALKNTSFENLDDFFVGPTSVTYSNDPVSASKVIYNFSKENEKLKIIAAKMGEKDLTLDEIKNLASLPSMEILRGKIVGLILSPLRNIASLTKEPATKLTRLLNLKK